MTGSFLLILLACRPDAVDTASSPDTDTAPDEAVVETPGGALVAMGGALYAADAVQGTVTRLADGALSDVTLGGGPTRLVGSGAALYVSLRGSGEVAVLTADLTETLRAEVGTEPVGLALSADGSRLYAALSQEDAVVELSTTDLSELRRFPVDDEPRWLTRVGDVLLVAPAYGGTLTHIDLGSGTTTALSLPEVTGQQLFSTSQTAGTRRTLEPRITGDMGISDDGAWLAVPLLFVDPSPDDSGADTSYADEGLIPGSNRFTGAVMELPVGGGMPDPDSARLIGIRSGNSLFSDVDAYFGSYPSAAVYAPGERVLWVPQEGSRAVVTVDLTEELSPRDYDGLYFALYPMAAAVVEQGPCTVVFDDDGLAHTYSFLDQHITTLSPDTLADGRDAHAEAAVAAYEAAGEGLEEDFGVALPEAIWITHAPPAVAAEARTLAALTPMDADLQTGLTLFYSANDDRMAQAGADVSCTTCHTEGRTDRQTWHLTVGARQTLSLTGGIRSTAPFTWSNDVETIADEAKRTSVQRMGGVALNSLDLGHLEDFIASLRPVRLPAVDPEAVARGAEAFQKAGCDACHAGAILADTLHHDILDDVATNTPTLRGIAATPPYFHDGSAATLRDVLLFSQDGSMGDTSGLSEAELSDLEAWLRAQ